MKKFVIAVRLVIGLAVYSDVAAQSTQIKFFGQPGFDYGYNSDAKQGSPYFRTGQLVTYVTSQLSDRVSAASELNVHYNVGTGAEVEVERLYLRYLIKDNLALRIGKTYNPLGFWNLNYNLGLSLQPTITRPTLLQPNHDGGFTQTRDVGIMLEGDHIGGSPLFFNFFVANGLGKNAGLQGSPYALGKTVAVTTQVGIEPKENLKISASVLVNPLERGAVNPLNSGSTFSENINYWAGVFSISYMSPFNKLELITEYYTHHHDYQFSGDKSVGGGMLYLGYKASDKIIPYLYAENFSFAGGVDPFYPTTNIYTDQGYVNTVSASAGFRYRFAPNIIFKFEGGALNQDIYGTTISAKTQLAFSY